MFVHRAYHPETGNYVYWKSTKVDIGGDNYDKNVPFDELIDISILVQVEDSFRLRTSEFTFDFDAFVAKWPSLVLMLGPTPEFPWMQDYAGTLLDDDLIADSLLPAVGERGYLWQSPNRTWSWFKEALRIEGEGTWHLMFRFRKDSSGYEGFHWGGSGENLPSNFLYRMRATRTLCDWFAETASGMDHSSAWLYPERLDLSRDYLLTITRSSTGELRTFLNGQRLGDARSVTNGTNNDGIVSNMNGEDGSGGSLNVTGFDALLPAFIGIHNRELTPDEVAEFASDKPQFTSDELTRMLVPDATVNSLLTEAGTVALVRSDNEGIFTDYAGTIGPSDWSTAPTLVSLIEGRKWAKSLAQTNSIEALQIDGALTARALMQYRSNSGVMVDCYSSGETPSSNYLYRIGVTNTELNYFTEKGSGDNISADFALGTTLADPTIVLASITRKDLGDGTCELRAFLNGRQLTCTSTTGTNNGDHALIPLPEGAEGLGGQVLKLHDSAADNKLGLFHLLNQATEPERELEVAKLLGVA